MNQAPRLEGVPVPPSSHLGATDPLASFSATVRRNHVTLLHDDACLSEMLAAIAAAKREVLFEMYWFGSDRTGRRFADAFAERARRGVRVCVVYDAVGSIEADERMFADMREAGCEVHQYHPVAPWRRRFRIGLVNHRDHRKILVTDGAVAFTGGVNASDHSTPRDQGGCGWRDDGIRVEGPAASRFREVFARTWEELGGAPLAPLEAVRRVQWDDEHVSPVRVLAGDYRASRAAIRRAYLDAIEGARTYVYLSNSYFVPDRAVRRALAGAAHAGLDVRVLVPGVSDVPVVQYASQRLYGWLMRQGIRLYEWQGSVLHSKTAVIDGRWSTVGTYNLDQRSWRANLEVNVMVEDRAVATALAARFRRDLERSVPVDAHAWRYRPLGQRAAERFCFLFRKLL